MGGECLRRILKSLTMDSNINRNRKRTRASPDNDLNYDSDSDDEARQEIPNGWPRYLLVKAASAEKPLSKLSPFAVEKAFKGISSNGFSSIKHLRDGSFLVQCKTENASRQLRLRNNTQFVDRPILVESHRSLNSSKGVIRCQQLGNLSELEIKKELKSQGVIDVHRCKAKGDTPTNTYFVTFAQPELPETIKIGYLKVRVSLYIPSPMRCFKCQKFGHTSSRCSSESNVCVKCGQSAHDDDCQPRCINCEGRHAANSKECPRWRLESAIQRVRAERKVSFGEAKKIAEAAGQTAAGSKSFAQAASQNQPSQSSVSTASADRIIIQQLVSALTKLTDRFDALEKRLAKVFVTGPSGAGSSGSGVVTGAPAGVPVSTVGAGSSGPKEVAGTPCGTPVAADGAGSSGSKVVDRPPKRDISPALGREGTPAVVVDLMTSGPSGSAASGVASSASETAGTSRTGGWRSTSRGRPSKPHIPPKPDLSGSKPGKGGNRYDLLADMEH